MMPCRGSLGARNISLSTIPSQHIHTHRALQHDEFWRQWGDIAHECAQLLAQFPCPWDSVAATPMQSNRLLLKCPDRRLKRIARLS